MLFILSLSTLLRPPPHTDDLSAAYYPSSSQNRKSVVHPPRFNQTCSCSCVVPFSLIRQPNDPGKMTAHLHHDGEDQSTGLAEVSTLPSDSHPVEAGVAEKSSPPSQEPTTTTHLTQPDSCLPFLPSPSYSARIPTNLFRHTQRPGIPSSNHDDGIGRSRVFSLP